MKVLLLLTAILLLTSFSPIKENAGIPMCEFSGGGQFWQISWEAGKYYSTYWDMAGNFEKLEIAYEGAILICHGKYPAWGPPPVVDDDIQTPAGEE